VAAGSESAESPAREEPLGAAERVFVESRLPVGLAVGTYIAITIVLKLAVPDREGVGSHWVVPGVEMGLLVCLLAADPARVAGHRRWFRRLAIALVLALAAATLLSTALLIRDLIIGGKVTNAASTLLAAGALIWLGNVLVFSLIYWLLDSGGPLARYLHERPYPDFAFSQQLTPELAPPDWRARYVDYLMLGLTTSTAFSPTDVMPMVPWAKLTMALQALISLVVVGLVIARAVNVFS
jgi:hypothetical protein